MENINSIDTNLTLRLKSTVKVPPLSELETLTVADIKHLSAEEVTLYAVSYTHLTLPTIYSV